MKFEIKRGLPLLALLFAVAARAALRQNAAPEKATPNSHQKSVLQNTMKALLDFKRLPKQGDVIRPMSKTGQAASKYMRKLFQTYRTNPVGSGNFGNIVRSFNPTLGELTF